jgi:hypothetical protein
MQQKLELYEIDLNSSADTFGVKINPSSEWVQHSVDEFMFYLQEVGRIDAYDPDEQTGIVIAERYDQYGDIVTERAYTFKAYDLMREIMLDSTSALFEDFITSSIATL